jgi:DNA-binding transcriptional ArsR family regulator
MTAPDPLSITFSALADPTRRAILMQLMDGEASVGELARGVEMSAPSFSRHIKVLEGAGLITRHTDAQWRRCQLRQAALQAALEWLRAYERLWDDQLGKLADYVDQLEHSTSPRAPNGRNKRRRR